EMKVNKKAVETPATGADLFVKLLAEADVDTVFGYPGGSVLPIYDALYRNEKPFKHILSLHEQGAIFAAEGYARATRKPGVGRAAAVPGATVIIAGLTDAMMHSLTRVVFTGQGANEVIGTDPCQESDARGITAPITRYSYQGGDIEGLPRLVKEAFH